MLGSGLSRDEIRAQAKLALAIQAQRALEAKKNEAKWPKPQDGPQSAFLESDADIVIFGGSAGGGKSFGLFLSAAQIHNEPTARWVYLRREQADIAKAGGPWDKSMYFFPLYGATPNKTSYKWRFPSGCEGQLASLQYDQDVLGWQTAELDLLLFDELNHFTENQFWYMQSRLRNTSGIRTRTRAGTNPSPGWVKKLIAPWVDESWPRDDVARPGEIRYLARIDGENQWVDADWRYSTGDRPKSITFIRSSVYDNKILMAADPGYITNLLAQTAVEKARLLDGDWSVMDGRFFDTFNAGLHHVMAMHQPKSIVDGQLPPQWWTYFGGLDWGYDDPTAFVLCGVSETGAVHVLESWKLSRQTNEVYADKVCGTIKRWGIPKSSCLVVFDKSMENKRTVNGIQAEADIEAFRRAGLRLVAGEHGREANRHRNSQIRSFLATDNAFRVYRGYNDALVESLEGATHASHDNEQVAHDDFSHLVFSLGLALSTRPKAVVAPPPVLTTEERKVHLKMEYDKTNQEIMESMLERRNNAQGIVKKVDPDTGDVTWVKESVSRRNQDRRGGPAGDAGYRRGGGISPGFQRGGGISRTD